jgi:hypothetical protein
VNTLQKSIRHRAPGGCIKICATSEIDRKKLSGSLCLLIDDRHEPKVTDLKKKDKQSGRLRTLLSRAGNMAAEERDGDVVAFLGPVASYTHQVCGDGPSGFKTIACDTSSLLQLALFMSMKKEYMTSFQTTAVEIFSFADIAHRPP